MNIRSGAFLISAILSAAFAYSAQEPKFDPYKAVIRITLQTIQNCQKDHEICAISFMNRYSLPITSAGNKCLLMSTMQSATQKAKASATFGKPTTILKLFSEKGGILHLFKSIAYKGAGMKFLPGGYPLYIGKKLFGAVGVQVQTVGAEQPTQSGVQYAQNAVQLWQLYQQKPQLLSKPIIIPSKQSNQSGIVAYYALLKGLSACQKKGYGCYFSIDGLDGLKRSGISDAKTNLGLSSLSQARANNAAMSAVFSNQEMTQESVSQYNFTAFEMLPSLPNGFPIKVDNHVIGGVGVAYNQEKNIQSKQKWVDTTRKLSETVVKYFESHYHNTDNVPCERV